MRINELFEVSANPAYLRAAERSRSQAQATQRTFDKSPEEKAAARRTELKRDAGIAGYTKRHRAANPDAYPTPKTQPAPQLRDPSTEYSDDYSVWAAGRRDTMEQGVAEGSLNEGQYEMMMRNGQVKKFVAKDDADAKRIAAGYGAKSVIRLKGGVPAGKVSEQGVAEGSGQEPGDFEIYDLRTMQRVYHPFEADDIMDAFVKADDWLEAIGKSGRGLSVRPVREQGVAEGRTK